MRDDFWLMSRLDHVWTKYFQDIKQTNRIFIQFGRFARLRLGSIKLDKKGGSSVITITRMFADPKIPVEVIDHTIAHELAHYTHGFSSAHPRLFRYPHEGGVVKKELVNRGMHKEFKVYQGWMGSYKKSLLKRYGYG